MLNTLRNAGPLMAAITLVAACHGGASDRNEGAAAYSVGGQVSGLDDGKTVVIGDANGPRVSVGTNGAYSVPMAPGATYDLAVLTPPVGQTCRITQSNGAGTSSADVGDIDVACQTVDASAASRYVSGTVTVTGEGAGLPLALQLQAGDVTRQVQVGPDGRFSVALPAQGDAPITLASQPTGLTCSVVDQRGEHPHARAVGDSPAVTIACTLAGHTLSGTVTGNTGTVMVRNSVTGELVAVVNDGSFFFAQRVPAGGTYAVTVAAAVAATRGDTMRCTVANGSGKATAHSSVAVACVTTAAPVTPAQTPHR